MGLVPDLTSYVSELLIEHRIGPPRDATMGSRSPAGACRGTGPLGSPAECSSAGTNLEAMPAVSMANIVPASRSPTGHEEPWRERPPNAARDVFVCARWGLHATVPHGSPAPI